MSTASDAPSGARPPNAVAVPDSAPSPSPAPGSDPAGGPAASSALESVARVVLGLSVLAVCSLSTMVVLVPMLPWRVARIKLCNVYGKVVGRTLVWVAGATPRVHHAERLGASMPAIFVGNHTSALDMFLSIWMCPIGGCGVMKKEIVFVPFFGWLYFLSGHLRIDRGNRERAVEALRETAELVKAHRLGVWMMPEGTRSRSGRLLPFKKGFVHLAIASGLPVVPVVIHGAHRTWRHGSYRFVPSTIDVDVLPAIDTSAWREETAEAHAAEVHAIFCGALREDQRPATSEAPQAARS